MTMTPVRVFLRKGGADTARRSIHVLTPSEQQVWDLHSTGMTTRQIADHLGQTPGSVKVRLSVAKEKMEVNL